MSKLDDLIKELCPNGVEYKTLGEIATEIYRGSGITREQVTSDGVPCVRYGEIYTTYGVWFDKCVSHTRLEYLKSPKYFEYGDILFAITGEQVEDVAKSTAYVGHEKCVAGGDIVVLKHKQNPKYLSYALSTYNAIKQKSAGKIKSKVVHSSVPSIASIKIPVPSLAIQARIVEILDNFDAVCSDLRIGLPAEINARRKQYEYYRDLLLSFDKQASKQASKQALNDLKLLLYAFGVVKTSLGEIARYGKQTIAASGVDQTNYVTVENLLQDKKGKTDAIKAPTKGKVIEYCRNDVLIGNIRPYLRKIWLADRDGGTNGDVLVVRIAESAAVSPKYLYYVLSSEDFFHYDVQNSKGSKMPRGDKKAVMDYRLSLPVPAAQSRLASVLDQFSALCGDLTQGLPAEIAARKKQYEYYRDKLLSFE